MPHVWLALLMICLAVVFPYPGCPQDLPVFDAHVHYSQPDWPVYPPEVALAILDQAGVRWAMVSSTPDEGTIRLYERAPARIAPILRPYRTPADMGTWTTDALILPYVEARLKRGIYKGLGEVHLSAAQAGDPVVRSLADLARRSNLFLYTHTDATGIEALLTGYPNVRFLWAHTGLGEPFETVARVIENHPSLLSELSLKYEVASGGRLDPRWKELFLRHPDRFMVGSDTWVTSQWPRLPEIHAGNRAWLRQLPPDVAERLAFKNAASLAGKP
jgi:hypothetical protein